MAKEKHPKPQRLAEKLRQIRDSLGLSQSEMLRRLGMEDVISYTKISHYELGVREPSLVILLHYARVAGVCVDVLIDDEIDLPVRMRSNPKHKGTVQLSSKKR